MGQTIAMRKMAAASGTAAMIPVVIFDDAVPPRT
jgi:hypothetical protein